MSPNQLHVPGCNLSEMRCRTFDAELPSLLPSAFSKLQAVYSIAAANNAILKSSTIHDISHSPLGSQTVYSIAAANIAILK